MDLTHSWSSPGGCTAYTGGFATRVSMAHPRVHLPPPCDADSHVAPEGHEIRRARRHEESLDQTLGGVEDPTSRCPPTSESPGSRSPRQALLRCSRSPALADVEEEHFAAACG